MLDVFNSSRFGRLDVDWSVENMSPDHVHVYMMLLDVDV